MATKNGQAYIYINAIRWQCGREIDTAGQAMMAMYNNSNVQEWQWAMMARYNDGKVQ